MKKLVSILKNKEIMNRILFTILILFVFRIGAQITVPGVTIGEDLSTYLTGNNALSLMNLLGGGKLEKSLTVQANAFSKSAEEAINNAGGKIEVI